MLVFVKVFATLREYLDPKPEIGIATEMEIPFKKNAGLKKMQELLSDVLLKHDGDEGEFKREYLAQEAPTVEEKMYLGKHPITGEKVYK